ncbi:MAG: hypothetical protein MI922_14215, partial [Bacteroidales bacterium]|nr:hypothetical protein [Bacteroidales bacterium]
MRRSAVFVVLCILAGAFSFAGVNTRFYNLSVADGLAHADVLCFEQDSNGFIWIGTRGGLHKYDGNKIHHYFNSFSTEEQLNNRILKLKYHKKNLWVVTEWGLYCFNIEKEHFEPIKFRHDSIHDGVVDINFDNQDNIWLVTTQGLYIGKFYPDKNVLDIKKAEYHSMSRIMERVENYLIKVVFDRNNNAWILTNRLLLKVGDYHDNKILEIKRIMLKQPRGIDLKVHGDKLYVLTLNAVCIYNTNNEVELIKRIPWINIRRQCIDDKVVRQRELISIEVQNDNKIWLGTLYGLIEVSNYWDDKVSFELHQQELNNDYALTADHIFNLFVDRFGILWIGTHRGGVCYLENRSSAFNVFNVIDDKTGTTVPVRSFYGLKDSSLLIGTDNAGIYIVKNNIIEPLINRRTPHSIQGRKITGFATIDNENIWVSSSSGIDVVNLENKEVVSIYKLLRNNDISLRRILGLTTDNQNCIWAISNRNWIYRFIPNKDGSYNYKTYDLREYFETKDIIIINCIVPVKNGVLIGTAKGLIRIFNEHNSYKTQTKVYTSVEGYDYSLTNNNVWQIEPFNDSVLFIATYGFGLNKFVFEK